MKKFNKKYLLVLLLMILSVTLVACGGDDKDTAKAPEEVSEDVDADKDKDADDTDTDADSGATLWVDIGEWSIDVEGVEGHDTFTSDDLEGFETVKTVEMTITDKTGDSKVEKFTGVTLKEILESMGVTEFSKVIVEAADGFSAEYDESLALDEDTILAWGRDGEAFDSDQPIRMCPKNGTGNQFVKDTAKIIVE